MLHTDLPPSKGGAGGVRQQVARLCDTLAGRGHEVVTFVLSADDGDRRYEVTRLRAGSICADSRPMRVALAPVAFAAHSYSGFDVVHAHGDSELLVRRRIPVVRTFYGSAADEARHATSIKHRIVERYHSIAEPVARRVAWRTVGISRATAASIGPLDHIIPCGVDLEVFRPGAKAGRPTVVFVGTMKGRKRGELVADAFRKVIRPRFPDAELVLIGSDAMSAPGITAIPVASDEALAEHLRSAWVFTLPSSYEGFGVPYIEAMASGTAVVATPNAGARELLGDGHGGGVVVSEDQLGTAIVRLLGDASARDRFARIGREVSRRFAWDVVARRYEDVYAEACDGRFDLRRGSYV